MKKTIALGILTVSFILSAPSFAQIDEGGDPCPIPSVAITQSPDDLAKVQADIDRFTLCVERAQLLSRLNDLALENQQAILGVSIESPGLNLEQDLPDFDRAALPSPVSLLPAAPLDRQEGSTDWIVVNIYGAGGKLQARLLGPENAVAQVRRGDRLPDGDIVKSISATAVTIQNKDGDEVVLTWRE